MKDDKGKIEKLSDEEFTIVTELDRKKKYLREGCCEFREYESDTLASIARNEIKYSSIIMRLSILQAELTEKYMEVKDFSNQNNIHSAEKEKFAIDYEVISDELAKVKNEAKNFKESIKVEQNYIDSYAKELSNILLNYAKNKDYADGTMPFEQQFNFVVVKMLLHGFSFHYNLSESNTKYELTEKNCECVVREYSIIVDDFISKNKENHSSEETLNQK